MRINQYLAFHLGYSRRKAEEPVLAGLVKVNGKIVTELFSQVDEQDLVEIRQNGIWKPISNAKSVTLCIYKPTFCVTTRSDPQRRRTVYDLLPKKYATLKTAGRLDFMSEGLLVLSSDGELIQELTHPSRLHQKIYLVGLHKPLSSDTLDRMRLGELEIDTKPLAPVLVEPLSLGELAKWSFLKLSDKLIWYNFTLSEGRNNQIRKMCEAGDSGVARLIRVKQAEIELTEELFKARWLEM